MVSKVVGSPHNFKPVNFDEFVKSRIHQVLGVMFYVNDIFCFNKDLKLKS